MTAKFNGSGNRLFSVNYNARRMATSMTVGNQPGYTTSFSYDANGYRIKKANRGGTKIYLLEGEHIESVYDRDYNLQANYLRGAVVDEIINGFERNDDTGKMENRTFHHDQVNSVVAVSDHNGKAVQEHSYGPFGETFDSSGTSQNTMKYTGREQDDETGLYYYRARYYDPELGRFISEDPIGFKGGINFYAYVGNNPLNYRDPTGHYALADDAAAVAIGALVGVTGVALHDLFVGKVSSWGAYTGAAAGGAVGGLAVLYAPVILPTAGTYSLLAASGATSSLVGGTTKQGVDMLTDEQTTDFQYDTLAYDVLFGTVTNLLPGVDVTMVKGVKVMGTTATTEAINNVGTNTLNNLASDGIGAAYENIDNSGASGGFLIYPNKVNGNMTKQVYAK